MAFTTQQLDWDNGQLIQLSGGITARCGSLVNGELYSVILYNTSQINLNAVVTVVWSNQVLPSTVTIPGTINNAGPAYFLFLSGTDSSFISISLAANVTANVSAFIVSISMPLNTTGLNNSELPMDGTYHPYQQLDRYFAIPVSGWAEIIINNPITQFISLQLWKSMAKVIVVNLGHGLAEGQVTRLGTTAELVDTVKIVNQNYQSYTEYIQINNSPVIWMNGDSQQNSQYSRISLQGLSNTNIFVQLLNLRQATSYISKKTIQWLRPSRLITSR